MFDIMKRIITVLLICLLICSLFTACGEKKLTDGRYTVEVTLAGGTGRASVTSPTTIVIDGDKITATIIWSSPYYEYMIVDDVKYEPIQTEGNSTFEIPVELDKDMTVRACTVAMSQPHEIQYTLHFKSSTIKGVR